jgi:hypothetical protein
MRKFGAKGKEVSSESIHVFPKRKRGVSAVVATVFLIVITISAVAIIWGMVIPFIEGNLDLDQRQVDLQIVTSMGYTVYDPEQGIAYVQVSRGSDNVSLHGMELMIEFGGTTYRVTLREPIAGGVKSYFFDMAEMKEESLLPGSVSVAPVFILDGRQVLGKITSKINMPIMTITKEKDEIMGEDGFDINTEFVNITLENQTQNLVDNCYTGLPRDPWRGCPIAQGDVYSVSKQPTTKFDFDGTATDEWDSEHSVKFYGDGNCIVQQDTCVGIAGATAGNSWSGLGYDFIQLSFATPLTSTNGITVCTGINKFYIYEGLNC